MRFTVSARGKEPCLPVGEFLASQFAAVPLAQIDSVFGFVEACTLYGGRPFRQPELLDADVLGLYLRGIGLRLPLTNHYVERREFELCRPFLAKYHREGNAAIVTNDILARWIREEFPLFRLEASVIKNLNHPAKIERAMTLYDTVVLPMALNQEPSFLAALPHKDRITLFANAGCALTCPAKICYPSISRLNKFRGGESQCSRSLKEREMPGMVDFDLEALQALGFSRFKLLRARRVGGLTTGY